MPNPLSIERLTIEILFVMRAFQNDWYLNPIMGVNKISYPIETQITLKIGTWN